MADYKHRFGPILRLFKDIGDGSHAQVVAVNGAVTVDGTVEVTPPSAIVGPGDPVIYSYGSVPVQIGSGTDTVVANPGPGKAIAVYGLALAFLCEGEVSFVLTDRYLRPVFGPAYLKTGMFVLPLSGNFAKPWFVLPTNTELRADTSATVGGVLTYGIVEKEDEPDAVVFVGGEGFYLYLYTNEEQEFTVQDGDEILTVTTVYDDDYEAWSAEVEYSGSETGAVIITGPLSSIRQIIIGSENDVYAAYLANCSGLETFETEDGENLATLELASPSTLKTLTLQSVWLSSLDLSGYAELTQLRLQDSRLTEINLTGCAALSYINVSRIEDLEVLDVSPCVLLAELTATECSFESAAVTAILDALAAHSVDNGYVDLTDNAAPLNQVSVNALVARGWTVNVDPELG